MKNLKTHTEPLKSMKIGATQNEHAHTAFCSAEHAQQTLCRIWQTGTSAEPQCNLTVEPQWDVSGTSDFHAKILLTCKDLHSVFVTSTS